MIIQCGKCQKHVDGIEISAFATYECPKCQAVNEVLNVPLKSWIGFNYAEYVDEILDFIRDDVYTDLKAANEEELKRGYLSSSGIATFKSILEESFVRGDSIRDIVTKLKQSNVIPSLKKFNADGEVVWEMSADVRTVLIARTETIRASNEGAQKYYKSEGIGEYSWTASVSRRTCELCQSLNGKIFKIGQGPLPPYDSHAMCRCSISPVTRLS
jgi:SPP1 gp7 family putative phage head morphogenesis protein